MLAPAYDLLPVNAILPNDKEEFALTMNGKKMHIRKGDFFKFAKSIGLDPLVAKRLIASLLKMSPTFLKMCDDSALPQNNKERLLTIISERSAILA